MSLTQAAAPVLAGTALIRHRRASLTLRYPGAVIDADQVGFNVELANMHLIRLVIVFGLAAATAACATNRTDLTETGGVKVRIDDGPGSALENITVYSEGEETVIRGRVYRSGIPTYTRYGKHVHVAVISPDGEVIASEDPRMIWQKSSKFSTSALFTVRLREPVPNDAVVDVVLHDTLHNNAPGASPRPDAADFIR